MDIEPKVKTPVYILGECVPWEEMETKWIRTCVSWLGVQDPKGSVLVAQARNKIAGNINYAEDTIFMTET